MKFDFVIGNPPYQEENKNNGCQDPVYDKFMDESFKISDCVELITPARFLFDAGQTSTKWNQKMLSDEHFKVLEYYSDSSKVFSNTEIKGGVAISLRCSYKNFGPIGIFTEYEELNTILQKVLPSCNKNISEIAVGGVPYKYAAPLKEDLPNYIDFTGKSFDLRTNTLDKLAGIIYFEEKPLKANYVAIYGLFNKKRASMWIDSKYLITPDNFKGFKVLLAKASGSGKFGEAMSNMIISEPFTGHTQSFVSIGNFETIEEAINLEKYIKTKFCRCMLSILKTTQDMTPSKWKYVPDQDFTSSSDIDWNNSISNIDKQLYKKYNLSQDEIDFIENNVKEME